MDTDNKSSGTSGGGYQFATGGFIQPRFTNAYPQKDVTHTVVVDKRTHRIKFENETESGVTIIIEPK